MQTLILVLALAPQSGGQIGTFLERHCTSCHGEDVQKGDLRLDTLKTDFDDLEAFATWVKVHDRLKSGEMPPKKKRRPPEGEKRAVLSSLDRSLHAASLADQKAEGRVRYRRLNRVEYENTVRDLLALPHLSVKEMLPADPSAHGFDNIGAALNVSYVQIARYLGAAEEALDRAIRLGPKPESTKARWPAANEGRFRIKEPGEKVKVPGGVGFLRQPNSAQAPWHWTRFRPPVDGLYRIRFRLFGFTWDKGRVKPADRTHVVTVYASPGKSSTRRIASFDVPKGAPGEIEMTAWLTRKDKLITEIATMDDRNINGRNVMKYVGPGVGFEWMESEGPLTDVWPPRSTSRIFGDLPVREWTAASGLTPPSPSGQPVLTERKRKEYKRAKRSPPRYHVVAKNPEKDAERLLVSFAERAFRRPVEARELRRYLDLVRVKLRDKRCFHDALRVGLKAVLCSPDFLYFQEPVGRLGDRALAARLSYFLWSSRPDAELDRLASGGELGRPSVLRAQVERMLKDPKAARFTENFLGQWLKLREINFTQPDKALYPEFDTLLLQSMVAETHATFDEMLRRDLGVRNVVDSDFVVVNGRLADLYGIEGVEGVALREVKLPVDSPRGGFLTQASVLKVTANGTTTSPVTRGAWVAERLMGVHVPPPPASVPAIEPDVRGATTIRELLDKHRNSPSCASCHVKIDPPGFALENFDVMGGWRDRYRSLEHGTPVRKTVKNRNVRYKAGREVESSDVRAFKAELLEDEARIARNVVERLLVYATGAGIQYADRRVVDAIVARVEAKRYGLRSILHEVVQSEPFRNK